MGKVIIFSAPSGSGKSTIINYLLDKGLNLEFSISATSRSPRGEEIHGKEYYFLSQEEFKKRVEAGEFLEWEEVYEGCFYGTLSGELDRIWAKDNIVLFDVDVVGGVNIKNKFGKNALSIFIQPPSIEELKQRLLKRGTDAPDKIGQRIEKAEYEMGFADKFDVVIVNDILEEAQMKALQIVTDFIESN